MMDFITITLKLYIHGLTTPQGLLYGVIPALALILLWRFAKWRFGRRELLMIEGTIESHAEIHLTRGVTWVNKVTLSLNDETRTFFENLIFRKNLWRNINANSVMGMGGKFFGWRLKNTFTVFSFANDNITAAFLDDFDKPDSLLRKAVNIGIRLAIIFFVPYISYAGIKRHAATNYEVYNSVVQNYFSGRDADATVAALGSLFFLLVAGCSLFLYFKQLRDQPEIFRKQLEMLDRAGVKRPLG